MSYKLEFKNIVIIYFIVYIIYTMMKNASNEKFTVGEMKNYQKMLQTNCIKSTEQMNKLKNMNKKRCIQKGKTQRDTINNKQLCYNDISKEIVATLDSQSNCFNLLSKTNSFVKSNKPMKKNTYIKLNINKK